MNRTTCALVATAISSLVPLSACGSLSRDTTEDTPSPRRRRRPWLARRRPDRRRAAVTPCRWGTHADTGEHRPVSAAEIHQMSRKGVFSTHGRLPDGSPMWGTAFIHDLDAELAITNAHVVDGVQGVQAVFFDGTEQPLDVLGSDPCADLAVIRVTGDLPEGSVRLPLGDSDTLAPGDELTAIGYRVSGKPIPVVHGPFRRTAGAGPGGDRHVDPSLPEYTDAIQHSATLRPRAPVVRSSTTRGTWSVSTPWLAPRTSEVTTTRSRSMRPTTRPTS